MPDAPSLASKSNRRRRRAVASRRRCDPQAEREKMSIPARKPARQWAIDWLLFVARRVCSQPMHWLPIRSRSTWSQARPLRAAPGLAAVPRDEPAVGFPASRALATDPPPLAAAPVLRPAESRLSALRPVALRPPELRRSVGCLNESIC